MMFNFYYHDGVLIDAGPPIYARKVKRIFNKYEINAVVITHGHYDHYGGLKNLLETHELYAYVHIMDFPFIHQGINAPLSKTSRFAGFVARFFIKGLEGITNILSIEEKYSLKDQGIDAKIIHTPGHTDGSISVVFKDRAYIGDLLRGSFLRYNKPAYPWAYRDLNQIKESIRKLASILPEDATLYPGHGKPFRMKDAIALL